MRANVYDSCPVVADDAEMSLRTHFQPGTTIVQVHGPIEAGDAARLRDHVDKLGAARPLIVDLRRVDFLGSHGFRTLTAIAEKFRRTSPQLVLVTNDAVDRVLRAMHRDHKLPVAPSVAGALRRLDRSQLFDTL